jgi:hypothetical protein
MLPVKSFKNFSTSIAAEVHSFLGSEINKFPKQLTKYCGKHGGILLFRKAARRGFNH